MVEGAVQREDWKLSWNVMFLSLVFSLKFMPQAVFFPCLVAASDIFANFLKMDCVLFILLVFDEEGHDSVSIQRKSSNSSFSNWLLNPFISEHFIYPVFQNYHLSTSQLKLLSWAVTDSWPFHFFSAFILPALSLFQYFDYLYCPSFCPLPMAIVIIHKTSDRNSYFCVNIKPESVCPGEATCICFLLKTFPSTIK